MYCRRTCKLVLKVLILNGSMWNTTHIYIKCMYVYVEQPLRNKQKVSSE